MWPPLRGAQRHSSAGPRWAGRGPATRVTTFHVQLGGLYDFLVHHKVGQLFEKDGARVDEDGVVEEGGLQREMVSGRECRRCEQ